MDAAALGKLLTEKGKTLGSIESFTGGTFASRITAVPGASHYFKGAIVTYATETKNRLVGVDYNTIKTHGVVSQEVAGEMAGHGKFLLDVDYCISFTGNAGPEAMENKPVGEIYIGIAFLTMCQVFRYDLSGTREEIQNEAIRIGFELLEKIILQNS